MYNVLVHYIPNDSTTQSAYQTYEPIFRKEYKMSERGNELILNELSMHTSTSSRYEK